MNIAIITGASSGLGREFAKQIDKKFKLDEIWVIARREERLKELSNRLKTKTITIKADLTSEDINKIIKRIKTQKPKICLLVNNAGYGKGGHFRKLDLNEQLGIVDLNVKALVRLTYEAIPYMLKNSKIINIASMASYFAIPQAAVYSASKAFVHSFSYALNVELRDRNIHVISVCPGPVNTEFFKRSGGSYQPGNGSSAKNVVSLALRHTVKNKWISVEGWKMKAARVLSRILSKRCAAKLINRFR